MVRLRVGGDLKDQNNQTIGNQTTKSQNDTAPGISKGDSDFAPNVDEAEQAHSQKKKRRGPWP